MQAELGLQYYAFEYMRKPGGGQAMDSAKSQSGTKHLFIWDGKKSCFSFNREEECTRDEKTCNFGQWCSKCSGRSHIQGKCYKD